MSQTITKANAASTTRITRVAAVVFAAVAVGLGVAGLPDRDRPSTEPAPAFDPRGPGEGNAPPPTGATQAPFTRVDSEGVAARLAMLGNAPTIAAAAPPVTPADPGPTIDPGGEPVYAGIGDRVRYMGMVQLGETRAALVRIDGRQQIVRENATVAPPPEHSDYPALTVERISGVQIVVSDGEGRAPVRIAERTGPSITMASGGPVTTVAQPAEAAQDDPSRARITNERELPQREIDRRARMLDRQRSGTINTNPEAGLRPPEITRTINASGRRNEQPDRNRRDD